MLVARSADYSFPSDHAVMAGAVTAGILLAHRTLGLVSAALALLMAATRVYVGAHFPLDVVAGLAVGAAVALVFVRTGPALVRRLVDVGARTPLRVLLTRRAREPHYVVGERLTARREAFGRDRSMRILVAEDDVRLGAVLEESLAEAGGRSTSCTTVAPPTTGSSPAAPTTWRCSTGCCPRWTG